MLIDRRTGGGVEARFGFVIIRARRNGDLPRDYPRAFEIVGWEGLAHLAYGVRTAAHVFDGRKAAEDIVRRLRRRAVIGAYDYLVEEFVEPASAHPG